MFTVPPYVYVCKPVIAEKRVVQPNKCDQQKCVFPTEQLLESSSYQSPQND